MVVMEEVKENLYTCRVNQGSGMINWRIGGKIFTAIHTKLDLENWMEL